MDQLLNEKEPTWATIGGEGFLAQGPLEWFRDRKKSLDEEISENTEALEVVEENTQKGKTNSYKAKLEKHIDELKSERKVIISRIKKLQDWPLKCEQSFDSNNMKIQYKKSISMFFERVTNLIKQVKIYGTIK